jgi:hypothetical protein
MPIIRNLSTIRDKVNKLLKAVKHYFWGIWKALLNKSSTHPFGSGSGFTSSGYGSQEEAI